QGNGLVEEEADHVFHNGEENNIEEDYFKFKTYENKYYTHDSDSKALFALGDEPVETMCIVNPVVNNKGESHRPTKEVRMCKVKVLMFKETLAHPVLKALDKECLMMWVEVNGHNVWTLWNPGVQLPESPHLLNMWQK
ncbi:hypothetical protein C0995_012366, partial [Termitomyces sp. Mi166